MEHLADAGSLFHALERSAFAAQIRDATWIYPLANVTHVLGLAVFFALVAAMDLQVLGVLPGATAGVVRRLRPFAVAGFVVMAASGLTLFAPEAHALSGNPAFRVKAAALLIAVTNMILFETLYGRRLAASTPGAAPAGARVLAGVSLLAWLTVAACGRAAAYL